jgi:hypothetical protein
LPYPLSFSPHYFTTGDKIAQDEIKKQALCFHKACNFDNNVIISWRTVAAFRKQSCELFLAATAAAMPRGHHSLEKKRAPQNCEALGISDNIIISWRTGVRDELP